MTASLDRTRGIPPNRATKSGLPLRWTLASKQFRSHLRDGGLVLGGQGFQHRCLGIPLQFVQSPDVGGQQVVVHDAPVFGPVRGDDVVLVQVLQGRPVPRLAMAPVGGTLSPVSYTHLRAHETDSYL